MELLIEYQNTKYIFNLDENTSTNINLDYIWENSYDYCFSIYKNNKIIFEFDHDDYVYIDDYGDPKILNTVLQNNGNVIIRHNSIRLELNMIIADNQIIKISHINYCIISD